MNTYEITKELQEIRSLMETEQYGEETGELIYNSSKIKERLDAIGIKRDDKLKAIEYIKREYLSMGGTAKAEKDRLLERIKMFDRKVDKLIDLQKYLLGGEKVETDLFTFSFKKSTSMITDNEDLISSAYKTVEKVDVTTIDKKKLKNDLIELSKDIEIIENDDSLTEEEKELAIIELGEYSGVHLEIKQNLQVK